ncbi:hypothetical protein A0H81_10848 [Grifola frondosa]|uniref:Uncharacterized protein n=1 Tax=Grifola frondosa TaxID=5627 RepID=A0A1C7M2F4_GRIFR|nr:hypothetical protein A0H81_10848 [Grifola frondosa]
MATNSAERMFDDELEHEFQEIDRPLLQYEILKLLVRVACIRGLPLDMRYAETVHCEDLLASQPDLEQSLLHALESHKWEDICRHSSLQDKQPAIAAWNIPNRGEYDDSIFASFVPIIQSSGTGKPRAVDQMANVVFALPFNLRSYPLADVPIRKFLTTFISQPPRSSEGKQYDQEDG